MYCKEKLPVVKPMSHTARDPYKLYPSDYVMKYTLVPLVPKRVTPNMITWVRFIGIPFVILFLYFDWLSVGVPLFIFLALTDALDGSVARLRKQVTDWGTLYDPVADKLLISTVVLLIVVSHINIIFGLLIVFVESVIVFVAYHRKHNGVIMHANNFGKTKMVLQVVGVSLLLIAVWAGIDLFIPISVGTLSLGIVFAVISLFTYSL
jgi:CDP-diacylglycerol---glycerol-3-phosphate 3-phosphatidyltransferase